MLNEAVGDLVMNKLFAYVTNYMNNSLARMTEETCQDPYVLFSIN